MILWESAKSFYDSGTVHKLRLHSFLIVWPPPCHSFALLLHNTYTIKFTIEHPSYPLFKRNLWKPTNTITLCLDMYVLKNYCTNSKFVCKTHKFLQSLLQYLKYQYWDQMSFLNKDPNRLALQASDLDSWENAIKPTK